MRSVTKHEKWLIGKIHLHDCIAHRHRPYPCWRFGYYSRSTYPISLDTGGLGNAFEIYHIIDTGAFEKMRGINRAMPMAFKPPLVAAQPLF